jgi:hypothetical protein
VTPLVERPNVRAALERGGLLPASPELLEQLTSACEHPEVAPDDILEISRAIWATDEQSADDVLVVQTRVGVFMIVKVKRRLLQPGGMVRVRCLYDWYQDVAEDDEMAGASVVFLAKPGHHHFLLSFPNAAERHRMFLCLFEAHAGLFSRWGLQLDPNDYVADFDRFYAEIVASGAATSEAIHRWTAENHGEYDLTNALGMAVWWRSAELSDEADATRAARVSMMAGGDVWWRADKQPQSRRVVVRLGEQLYDAGLLGPPYDERTFTDDPLSRHDAGPTRLLALMTLAAFAHALRDPRAREWIDASREGIRTVPPAVFPDKLRELWEDIGELPAVDDGPPREIPIWEDVDVRAITTRDEERSRIVYSVDMLTSSDRPLVTGFLDAVGSLQQQDAPSGEAVAEVCLRGVAAFEDLSPLAPTGWRKLIAYIVSDLTYQLWETHRLGDPAAKLAHWVVATIERNGWGPDGRTTPLGQHHSYAMGVASGTGVGVIQFDPATGEAKAPTGDEARTAAIRGRF